MVFQPVSPSNRMAHVMRDHEEQKKPFLFLPAACYSFSDRLRFERAADFGRNTVCLEAQSREIRHQKLDVSPAPLCIQDLKSLVLSDTHKDA